MKLHNLWWIVFVGAFIATSCQMERISQTQLKLERYAVTIQELPSGFSFFAEDWGIDFGGESYTRDFAVPPKNIIRFEHEITIFPDKEQALSAYPQWEDEWFQRMEKWPGADFTPSDPSDKYRF